MLRNFGNYLPFHRFVLFVFVKILTDVFVFDMSSLLLMKTTKRLIKPEPNISFLSLFLVPLVMLQRLLYVDLHTYLVDN